MYAKEAYMNFWQKMFVMKGRASRKEYWVPLLVNIVIVFLITIVIELIESAFGMNSDKGMTPSNVAGDIMNIILFVPSFTVTARRLQDININGKWAFAPYIYLAVLLLASLRITLFPNLILPVFFIYLGYFVLLLAFFLFSIMDGTRGPNKYGADPKRRTVDF